MKDDKDADELALPPQVNKDDYPPLGSPADFQIRARQKKADDLVRSATNAAFWSRARLAISEAITPWRVDRAVGRLRQYFAPSIAPNGMGSGGCDGDTWDEAHLIIQELQTLRRLVASRPSNPRLFVVGDRVRYLGDDNQRSWEGKITKAQNETVTVIPDSWNDVPGGGPPGRWSSFGCRPSALELVEACPTAPVACDCPVLDACRPTPPLAGWVCPVCGGVDPRRVESAPDGAPTY